ncbi:hypothetical protein X777_09753 [Ooceraea biroi]|uniref:Uncharacterized protein n=1 Tax=Ooceraea biroi TaxID=2015173 RepID=A0A026W934_OOCBI|nr:hypothetical protein X777_09753 [Ooceraea biroi]
MNVITPDSPKGYVLKVVGDNTGVLDQGLRGGGAGREVSLDAGYDVTRWGLRAAVPVKGMFL